MSIRSEIRTALIAMPKGLTGQQLFEVCDSADDEKAFAASVSSLKGQGKIKIISTTDEDKPRSIYGLDNWPEAEPKANGAKEPKPSKRAAKEKAPKKKRAKRAAAPAPEKPAADVARCDAQFAMNAGGELGIEKGEAKLRLAANEFAVLREFIERTQEVWDR